MQRAQGPGISSIPPAQDALLFCPGAPVAPHRPAPDPGAPGPLSPTGHPTTHRAQGLRCSPSLGCSPISPPVGIPKGTQFVLWQPIPQPQSRKLCSLLDPGCGPSLVNSLQIYLPLPTAHAPESRPLNVHTPLSLAPAPRSSSTCSALPQASKEKGFP